MIHADIVSGQYLYRPILKAVISVSYQKWKSYIGTSWYKYVCVENPPLAWHASSAGAISPAGWKEKTEPSPGGPLPGSIRSRTAWAVNKHANIQLLKHAQ